MATAVPELFASGGVAFLCLPTHRLLEEAEMVLAPGGLGASVRIWPRHSWNGDGNSEHFFCCCLKNPRMCESTECAKTYCACYSQTTAWRLRRDLENSLVLPFSFTLLQN